MRKKARAQSDGSGPAWDCCGEDFGATGRCTALPLPLAALAREPVNEAGVTYIFGMLAERLGFIVERMQRDFPDCEALYEVEPGKWQAIAN